MKIDPVLLERAKGAIRPGLPLDPDWEIVTDARFINLGRGAAFRNYREGELVAELERIAARGPAKPVKRRRWWWS